MLIALETGVAMSPEAWRTWDPAKRPATSFWPDSWKQGQTLKSAFQRSAVWYFQDLARDIGSQKYRTYLAAWNYGNASVPEGSDDFWLGQPLTISVREQVGFLEGLLMRRFHVAPKSLAALHAASQSGDFKGMSLHGKTGAGPNDPANLDGAFSGWYAGYLMRNQRAPIVFALFVEAPSFGALRDFRRAFSLRLLDSAGLIPAEAFQSR
jgi:beta-lactamase class D